MNDSNASKLREWQVTIPIAGHAYLTVEAATEEEAREIALNSVTHDDIETWEQLEQFNEGNVCYCPHPWEIEVVCLSGDEE